MRTPSELYEFCCDLIKKKGINKAELSRRINVTQAAFNMAEKRNSYFSIETLCKISDELNISLDDLLNTKFSCNSEMPYDIREIETMLLAIPEKDREIILLNVKNYYEKSISR